MEILTQQEIDNCSHISTEEIEKDLRDNDKEIKDYQDELDILNRNPVLNKVRIYMITGHLISHRQLSDKLTHLLKIRK